MNIGIITTWRQKCGIATYSGFLGEALLSNKDCEVFILAERQDVLPEGFDPDFDFSVPYTECWSRHEDFTKLLKVVKELKLDVVHIQHQFGLFPYELSLLNLLKGLKKLGVKIVVTLHDVIVFDPRMESYFRSINDYADKIIIHTVSCQQLLTRAWKCPPEKITFIYHGTKLIKVPTKKVARKKLNLPQDASIILSWGFIWESKGLTQLVEILAQLLKTHPKIMLIHAGGLHPVIKKGDYLKSILKKAFKLGINPNNFKITGFIDEEHIKLYFGGADIIVLNYARGSASASGAAHRVLSAHRPIIGTDDSSLEDIPRHIVSRFDNVGLYKGILKVLGDKGFQKKLIVQAEKRALETSWEKISKQHKILYDNLK